MDKEEFTKNILINDFINEIINTDSIDVWYESICFIFNEFISS